jgi:hypothetical protein
MPKAPAFQFYPADWLNDIRLRPVSFEVKGFLIDVMCLMHQSEKYGYLTKEFEESLPGLLGKDRRTLRRLLAEVEQKSLVKRDVVTGELFNKRMVHDEHIRQVRRESGTKGGQKRKPDLLKQKPKQKIPPSSSSSSSSSLKEKDIPDSVESGVDFYITKKGKKLNGKRFEAFMQFWEAFNYKKGKAAAADAWLKIPELTNTLVEQIILSAKNEASLRPEVIEKGSTPKWPEGWITDKRWEDEHSEDQIERQPVFTEEQKIHMEKLKSGNI